MPFRIDQRAWKSPRMSSFIFLKPKLWSENNSPGQWIQAIAWKLASLVYDYLRLGTELERISFQFENPQISSTSKTNTFSKTPFTSSNTAKTFKTFKIPVHFANWQCNTTTLSFELWAQLTQNTSCRSISSWQFRTSFLLIHKTKIYYQILKQPLPAPMSSRCRIIKHQELGLQKMTFDLRPWQRTNIYTTMNLSALRRNSYTCRRQQTIVKILIIFWDKNSLSRLLYSVDKWCCNDAVAHCQCYANRLWDHAITRNVWDLITTPPLEMGKTLEFVLQCA